MVIGKAKHIYKKLKWLKNLFIYQAGGRRVPQRLAGVFDSVIHALDFRKAFPEVVLVFLRNPAGENKAVVVLGDVFADVEISVQFLQLAEDLLAFLRFPGPVIVNLLLKAGYLLSDLSDFILQLLEHFFRGGLQRLHPQPFKIKAGKNGVHLLNVFHRSNINSPEMSSVAGALKKQNIRIILIF